MKDAVVVAEAVHPAVCLKHTKKATVCNKCRRTFQSTDPKRVRFCSACRRANSDLKTTPVYHSEIKEEEV